MEQTSSQTYAQSSKGVTIEVTPTYMDDRSSPEGNMYAYAYHVRITNERPVEIQLMNRHWKVYSAGRQVADVKGEGVVGEQPVLSPNESYQYTSWTIVQDSMGHMEGVYTFHAENGEFFDVTIPRFDLVYLDPAEMH